jgi:hypothetical protein
MTQGNMTAFAQAHASQRIEKVIAPGDWIDRIW